MEEGCLSKRRATRAGEVVFQELEFENSKDTLGEAKGETMEVEQLENLAMMVYMSVQIMTEDQDIVYINKTDRI